MASFTLRINGTAQTLSVEPDTPLLYVLRNDLGLHGPKFGCGLAQCGACSVLVDGKDVRYCGNGMVIAARALLEKNARPTNQEIREALNGHLCRCASHNRIVRAVQKAAKETQS